MGQLLVSEGFNTVRDINNSNINDFLKGFTSGLPGMKDYRHASQLYIADNHKLMPKQKFLFHVYFDINEGSMSAGGSGTTEFSKEEKYELNMLVKACDLPKYDFNVEEKNQYNKKTYVGTRIGYQPIVISFHDDHADTVNAFWKKYYEYHIADSLNVNTDLSVEITKPSFFILSGFA